MMRYTVPAALLAVAVLVGACSDQTLTSPDIFRPDAASLLVEDLGDMGLQTCPNTGVDGWTKIDAPAGSASGGFGSLSYANESTEFDYVVNPDWVVQFCLKYGNALKIYEVTGYEAGTLSTGQNAISHTGWRVMYEPPYELVDLDVSKTAHAGYDRTVEWGLTKTVNGVSELLLTGVPGQSWNVLWQVVATKSEVEGNYAVHGVITVGNPNPVAVRITVGDILDDGTVAAVDCGVDGDIWVAAEDHLACSYYASPTGRTATLNTATVVVDSSSYQAPAGYVGTIEGGQATALVDFVENLIGFDGGTLADERFAYSAAISATTTQTFAETFECPQDVGAYDANGVCALRYENVAVLTFADDSHLDATARVEITCLGLYGCTPGFWKQEHHWGHWAPTGFLPTSSLKAVFGANALSGTFVQALDFGGGGGIDGAKRILLRAAVASLLNYAHPDVNFSIPTLPGITDAGSLISAVQAALAGDRAGMVALGGELDAANNAVNLCSLSGRAFQ